MKAQSYSKTVLRIISAIVGSDAVKELCLAKGGTEIWIPRECDADHWMSRLFGEDKANEICARLTTMNADDKLVCSVRCYVPNLYSRHAAMLVQLENEVKEALLAGKRTRDTAIEIGISERRVAAHKKFLIQAGLLPAPPNEPVAKPLSHKPKPGPEKQALQNTALAKAEQLLAYGNSMKDINAETGVSLTKLRAMKKALLLLGQKAKISLAPVSALSPDHCANIGEMVPPASDEVLS